MSSSLDNASPHVSQDIFEAAASTAEHGALVGTSDVGGEYGFDNVHVPADIPGPGDLPELQAGIDLTLPLASLALELTRAQSENTRQARAYARILEAEAIANHACGKRREAPLPGQFPFILYSPAPSQTHAEHGPLTERPDVVAAIHRHHMRRQRRPVSLIRAKPVRSAARINRARAVHSHAAHGPARAASGGEDGSSGSSSEGDGPPRGSGGAKDNPALTSEDVRAPFGAALDAARLDFPEQPKPAAISHAEGRP